MGPLRARVLAWVRSHADVCFDELALLAVLGLVLVAEGWPSYSTAIILAALGLNLFFPRSAPLSEPNRWQRLGQALPAQAIVAVATIILAHVAFDRPWFEAWWGLVWIGGTAAVRLSGLESARVLGWLGQTIDLARRLTWPFRAWQWIRRQMEAGCARAAVEAIAVGGAAWLGLQLDPDLRPWSVALHLAPWGWFALAVVRQARPVPTRALDRMLDWAVRQLVWSALLVVAAKQTGGGGSLRPLAAWMGDLGLLMAASAWFDRKGDISPTEYARILLVEAFGLWLAHQRAFPVPLGSDAQWYALTMSDVIAQFRAGVFPVFVGQTEFQFNGSVFPIRIAPLFHHLGMAADLLTLRTLTAAEIQNGVLICLTLAGVTTAYRGLAALLPLRRWSAALLAILYVGCPGTVAILYGGDLYMTWTTLPLIPLVLTAHMQTYEPNRRHALFRLGFWLGLLWWGHSPIALWMTTLVGIAQIVRVGCDRRAASSLRDAFGGFVIFGAVVLYPIISVLVVTPGHGAGLASAADANPSVLAHFLHETFPGVLLPVSFNGRQLSDYQLGWGLWGLAGGVILAGFRTAPARMLAVIWLALMTLLLPHSAIQFLWSIVPATLRNPTGNWVATRLYLIAAAVLVWLAAVSLPARPRGRAMRRVFGVLLAAAVAWTIHEDSRFVYGILNTSDQAGAAYRTLDRENRALTRYSYLALGDPPSYFTHGVVDPDLEQRILAPDARSLLIGNLEALASPLLPAGAKVLSEGPIEMLERSGPVWDWTTHLELRPGGHYALVVTFAHPEGTGVLKISGRTVMRLYALPLYGGPASFGSAPGASPIVALSSEAPTPQALDLVFIPSGSTIGEDFEHFGYYRWIRYDPAQLPVVVRGWVPYQADLHSPAAGWLETPRMFQPGYAATVNGRPAEVRRSPQGLVMAAVPGGRSEVVLAYHPPAALLLSYWISFGGIILGFGWVAGMGRDRPDRRGLSA